MIKLVLVVWYSAAADNASAAHCAVLVSFSVAQQSTECLGELASENAVDRI